MSQRPTAATRTTADLELVTMEVAGQPFGIPVSHVRDVLGPQRITSIPLASEAIAGSLNLRGRIVTVLDMRIALGLGRTENPAKSMNVVIDHGGELYSLLIDGVGDVLTIKAGSVEPPPRTLDPHWRAATDGIVKLDNRLLLLLRLEPLLASIGGAGEGMGT